MSLYRRLAADGLEILSAVGLDFISRWLRIRAHTTMMTVLVERWDSRACIFHLPTGEATITLLYVWRILKIPIRGVILEYMLDATNFYLWEVCEWDVLPMEDMTHMHLGRAMKIRHIPRLIIVIYIFLSGRLMSDLGGHGFLIGWSWCVYYMVHDCAKYAWGAVMLTQLYHDIHLVVYREYAS